jgi:ABC-2 type transport system permease protein
MRESTMSLVRGTLAIAWKELQVTFRDRGLLAILFLLPLVFATLFSLSQQSAADLATGVTPITVRVFVVNGDEGAYGRQVTDTLRQMTMLDIEQLASAEEADRRVGDGERAAAIIIPAGFSAGIDAYQPGQIKVVVDPAQGSIADVVVGLANLAASPVSIQGELLRGTRTFIEQAGVLAGAAPEVQAAVEAQTVGAIMTRLQAMQSDPPITVVPEGFGVVAEPVNLLDSFMPAFAVMFAFFLTGHVGQVFHRERDEGTFRRLLASPLSRSAIVAGPMVAFTAVVVLQVLFLFGIGAGMFKMEIGDSLVGLLAVSIALGLVVSTLGLLIGVLTRTGRQADTVGTLVAFVLPFISGIFPMGGFEPGYLGGGTIATIAMFIPHMHAAEGYRLVMSGQGTPETVLVQVGILLLFAAIFFAIAARRLRFS